MIQPSELHYVIISRRTANKKDQVETLLKGWPEFQVIVDRRRNERRKKNFAATSSDSRTGTDRRL